MARVKRSAYIIRIYTYNTHGANIVVSKKEFEKQLKYYSEVADRQRAWDQSDKHYEDQGDEDCEGNVAFAKNPNKWDEKSITETWIFADGGTEIFFTKITAKPGYRIA